MSEQAGSAIENSLRRLERAVARLEAAAARPPRPNPELEALVKQVSGRLDDAVGRLRLALEE